MSIKLVLVLSCLLAILTYPIQHLDKKLIDRFDKFISKIN